ncbi:DUF998 domain-containing protein [Actinopolymorpha alba]|uniref:DUF998 domain-containing protein n=1 Tax=Actinopolymorpha alba TaxID=533267 RepID=UPI000378465C|nr:DUF998 domain-containing protein [Actinopolymorpha alba]
MPKRTIVADLPATTERTRMTAGLLRCGAIAGPTYVAVSLAQALTRDGFNLARHPWSVLANGDLGWIQISNLVLAGVLTVTFAIGVRRVLRSGRGTTWAPRLLGLYGLGLVAGGVFVADPMPGFPQGTTADEAQVSWHGMLHFVAGGIGFAGLIAACLVLGARFAAEDSPGWAWFSRVTGVLFAVGFIGVGAGAGSAATNVAFGITVVLAWAWLTALAARLGRQLST